MEVAQSREWVRSSSLDERERCALLVEAEAARFERKKLFPLTRALRAVAVEIRAVLPAACNAA
jgi:hypothetical protein